jgi:signal-transduction protein with cAMP-binding, CBS, and nucleotidyltransferase domain
MFNLRDYEREPVTVAPDAPVREVADRMDEECVGSVVVIDASGAPLGIVTDRDLARRVVAAGRDPEHTRARDVMTDKLQVVERGEPLPRFIELCRTHAIRRVPVVEKGRVVSVVSLDDMLFQIAIAMFSLAEATRVEMHAVARLTKKRRRHEARSDAIDELRAQLSSLAHDVREKARTELAGLLGGPFSR